MRSTFVSLVPLAIILSSVKAQDTPAFIGELLIQPGLSNTQCMTAANNSDGAVVDLQPCTGAASQKWVFTNGEVRVFGDKCLDVPSGTTADGAKLQIWTCTGNNPNQQWAYNKWENTLSWRDRGKCLDLSEGSTSNGNRLQTWGCNGGNINQVWNVGYMANQLPKTSQDEQYGTNDCGTTSSQDSVCQTSWINSATDFCLYAPSVFGPVGNGEREAVSYCTKSGRGTRLLVDGTLTGVHWVKTPEYVQITGTGNFTKANIPSDDYGGELDNRGADGKGNPIGGLLYGNTFAQGLQYHEWTEFISANEFCIRACIGPRAKSLCNHIYDVMGCHWNMPANYQSGVFEECEGDSAEPMGVYGTSTWYQGVNPTPAPHPAPSSSNCQAIPTVSNTPARRDLQGNRMVAKRASAVVPPAFPGATPAP